MNYDAYWEKLKTKFSSAKEIKLGNHNNTIISYEEVFKWKWIATKLKIFSFVTYANNINEHCMEKYSIECLNYARKNMPGLPTGLQNGIVSNNILVSEIIDEDAIAYASARPTKHFSAFEIPIIVDLSNGNLYYYREKIIWGAMYDLFIKKYIEDNFSIHN